MSLPAVFTVHSVFTSASLDLDLRIRLTHGATCISTRETALKKKNSHFPACLEEPHLCQFLKPFHVRKASHQSQQSLLPHWKCICMEMISHFILSLPNLLQCHLTLKNIVLLSLIITFSKDHFYLRRNHIPSGYFLPFWNLLYSWEAVEGNGFCLENQWFKSKIH